MALPPEVIAKIQRIHIKTNFLSTEIFTGEYESAFKGSGMAFEEVREYVPGDDVRMIDWNVTARIGRPHLKVFRQERERSLVLMVDVSASMRFGGARGTKQDLAAEVAAVLAYAAIKSNDKVGLLLFSETVERYIPPKKGRGHIWRIIEEILTFRSSYHETRFDVAARFLMRTVKRRSICVVLSDFLDDAALQPLKILRGRHELVCLSIVDQLETTWPDLGLLPVVDAETGGMQWFDTSGKGARHRMNAAMLVYHTQFRQFLHTYDIDTTSLAVGESYLQPLLALFRRRERRRKGA